MESLLNDIIGWLTEVGPGVVFLVVMTETAFFIGLLVPAEATVLVAAYLAERGTFELEHVLAATLLGGLAGDQIGYALGRFGGRRVTAHGGRLGRLWSRHETRAHTMFNRHSIVAVSLARFVSFVRTLMPWFAGMSGVPYLRFAVFDALGVLGWGVASVAAGYLAGPGWRELAGVLGVAGAVIVSALVLGVVIAVVVRRRRNPKPTTSTSSDPDALGDRSASPPLLDPMEESGEPTGNPEPGTGNREPRMFRVGLTGNIASGKTAVARVWQRLGARVVDADELARDAVERGSSGLRRVVERFGEGVVQQDGSLDRAALRRIVFNDDAARAALEQILHPEIDRLRQVEERRLAGDGKRVVVHMVPLLFEAGLAERCDVVVLVDAPPEIRLRRIIETRGVDEAEAGRMIAAQMPAAQKRARADVVIENDGPLARLEARAGEVWNEIQAQAQ